MFQLFPTGRDGCLVVFGIGIANARPHILRRSFGNDFRVDECVHGRPYKKVRFQKGAIFVVHDRNRSACRTVRGDGREGKDRLIVSDTQTFYGV